MKIILTQNGKALNSPVGFEPAPPKSEAAPLEGAASGTDKPCKETFDAKIVPQRQPGDKEFSTLQARAARHGHELTASRHEGTGLTLWQVSRWGQSRQFSEWVEVCDFVARIGGGHA